MQLNVVFSVLDSAAVDNVIHKNKASRQKAKLAAALSAAQNSKTGSLRTYLFIVKIILEFCLRTVGIRTSRVDFVMASASSIHRMSVPSNPLMLTLPCSLKPLKMILELLAL